MSEPTEETAYLLDHQGKVVAAPLSKATAMLGIGYTPAGQDQIKNFQAEEALHAKFGTPGQQAITAAETAGRTLLPGIFPAVEGALLHNKEEQRHRAEENPGTVLGTTAVTVGIPLVLTGGAAAGPEAAALAGEGAAEAAPGIVSQIASHTAPGLIAKLGEGASGVAEHLIGKPATALGGVLAKSAAAGASGGIEGTAYGLGQVLNEGAMGDPHLTASHALEEVGLSGLLGFGIGGTTGVLSGLIGEAAQGKMGQKLSDWMETAEGYQHLKTASGPGRASSAIKKLLKSGMSPEEVSKLGQEGADLGLIKMLDQPSDVFEKASELKQEIGPRYDSLLGEADSSGTKPATINEIAADFRREVLEPYAKNPANRPAAEAFTKYLDANEERFGTHIGGTAEHDLTFRELHGLRKEASDEAYGLNKAAFTNPELSKSGHLYEQFRQKLSSEIEEGLDKAALPQATKEEWLDLNHKYSVASKIGAIAENGVSARGLAGLPLTASMFGLTGLIHGGPLGAAVMGGAAMLAKRYGPEVLAGGAKMARNLVDEEAAAGLASKTADAISASREAASEAGAATRASALWGKLGQKLEAPVVAPGKDLARDMAQEHMGHEGTPVETVAALSHLEAANQRVNERVTGLAKKLVSGESLKSATRGAAEAVTAEQMAQELEHIHHLQGNPDALLQHVTAQNQDLHQHAPDTAQALSVVSSRAVNYLHGKFPAPPRTPLGKPPKANKNDLWKYNRNRDVLGKPSNIIKLAASGRLLPLHMEAVAAVHPEALKAMQSAVLNELASAKTVSHTSRMMASVLLGQPLDPGMQQQAIAANQAVFNRPSAKSGEDQLRPMGKTTQGGMAKLNVAGHSMLPGQAVESRRSEA